MYEYRNIVVSVLFCINIYLYIYVFMFYGVYISI